MIYHLFILNTDNEIKEIISDSDRNVYKGFALRQKQDIILPVYMTIEDNQGRTYFIPQYELMHQFKLTKNDILVFLNECREKKWISLQLYNMLNYCGEYAGSLMQIEKDILNNLSIPYHFIDFDSGSNVIYKVEL